MARTPKKIDETKLTKLPVYERAEKGGFRFAHHFGEDRDLSTFALPQLSPLNISALDIAKLAISLHGEGNGKPNSADIESAVALLHECETQYERKCQKIINEKCENADKFIDINELMEASEIDAKSTLFKKLADVIGDEFASRLTTPNPHPCIHKDGTKGTIGTNGLMHQDELLYHFRHR